MHMAFHLSIEHDPGCFDHIGMILKSQAIKFGSEPIMDGFELTILTDLSYNITHISCIIKTHISR